MSLDQDVAVLARMPALRGFEPDALRLLAFAATHATFQPGDLLFEAGAVAEGAVAILSGRVILADLALDIRAEAGPGDLLDEMAMYVDTERAVRAEAVETATVMVLPRDMVRRVLVEFPASAAAVRDSLSGRLDQLSDEIGQIGQRLGKLDAE
ncbi:hypothetical protein GCM10019059_12670 [Camelimonas fluminis]|uniref:Crp/Fnr family transcriptional regulator n=1 Tax=Camelimonas fluminis TaxID=1576911 RepID=A0ABV7UKV7_9HYPH|nr:Crp/Fnr family transcriptional regulator [Camelimonas fluminis]GHE54824.1 hypothetical protein GCM10019059_12670 [Camelimonas fluminis]